MTAEDFKSIETTFLGKYKNDKPFVPVTLKPEFMFGARGAASMFAACNGASFNRGLYRLHTIQEIPKWTKIATDAFPALSGKICCFGFDWLGRQFALDLTRKVECQPGVSLLEPGTGQVLEIDANFLTFHCVELIEFAESALACAAFDAWLAAEPRPLVESACVGYKTPLFLGGSDTLDNMELSDMDVYWELCSQLLRDTRALPDGTWIKGITS